MGDEVMGDTENDANGLALVVDDDKISLMLIRTYLSEWGIRVRVADNAEEALNVLETESVVDIVFMDQRLPRMQGLEALEVIKGRFPHTQVVMLTAFGNISSAVRAIKGGACDYLNKPVERDQLELVTQRALKVARLERENEVLRARGADTGGFSAIVCQAAVMKTALERSRNLAVMDLTVLITGESGTGKELLARGIHDASRRHEAPFIAINCAALPEDLLSSALFGYEKGAFTGAANATKGCFEEADGGTLFLDEISEMSPKLQSSVLRALQEHEFYRLGSYKPVKSDFRLLCATNKNLEAETRAGRFRQDLFYRINVAAIDLPPLRERREDIPLLVERFLAQRQNGRRMTVSKDVMDALSAHNWPGNVRELKNVCDYLAALARDGVVSGADLPESVRNAAASHTAGAEGGNGDGDGYGSAKEGFERRYLEDTLKACGGNVTRMARYIGLSRSHLHKKLRKYNLSAETARAH